MLAALRDRLRTVVFAFPAILATTGLGLIAVYAAILGDMYARAAVNLARFASGAWETVSRNAAVAR